jgi:hypothetical protein
MAPSVDTDHGLGLKVPAGLFQGFPDNRRDQALTILQVSCGLIQHGTSGFPFLNQEKTPVLFDYCGDGYVWCPDHFRIINRLYRYGDVRTRNRGQMTPRYQFVRVMGNIATKRHDSHRMRSSRWQANVIWPYSADTGTVMTDTGLVDPDLDRLAG